MNNEVHGALVAIVIILVAAGLGLVALLYSVEFVVAVLAGGI